MRVAALLALMLTACGAWDSALQRMVNQPKDEAFGENSFFDDHRAMRPPPQGAIAREETLGPPELVTGLANGAPVDRIPMKLTRELLDRGRGRFEIFCAVCHGITGDGSSVVAANMQLRQPPSLHEPRIRELKVGELYRVVTLGYGLMPSYSAQLPLEDRWAVAAYVQALQLSQSVPISSLPAAIRDEAMQSLK